MACSTVNVAVRVRPYCSHELVNSNQTYVQAIPGQRKIQVADAEKPYRFDHVSGPETDNEHFYNAAVRNQLFEVFNERDVTIITYGNRGSGKTWTMGTNYTEVHNMGIIPRAINDLFAVIDSDRNNIYRVTVTFVELYNKELYDLLLVCKRRDERIVEISRDRSKYRGLAEKQVSSGWEALQCLIRGSQERVNSEKRANSRSSRSDAIFTISINQQKNGDPRNAKRSKLHLVDLAGTKRGKKEAKKDNENINKNLLAVGRMINQLRKGKSDLSKKYQDNKLTIFLKESLLRNSVTLFIACMSPADSERIETLDTLRYANRLRKIKNEIIDDETKKESDEIERAIDTDSMITSELNLGLEVQISASTSSQESSGSCKTELIEFESETGEDLPWIIDWENTDFVSEANLIEQKELQDEIVDDNMILDDETNKIDLSPNKIIKLQKPAELLEQKPKSSKSVASMILEQFRHALSYKPEHLQPQEFMLHVYTKIQDLLNEQNKFAKNLLKYVVVEDDDKNGENVELVKLQMEQYYEGQALGPYIALLEELVTSLRNESAPIRELVRNLEDTKYKINALEAEKLDLVQILSYTESYKENWGPAKFAMNKIADMDEKIWKLWAKRIKLAMDIERRGKFDQQITNMSAQIQMLKRARHIFIEEINKNAMKPMKVDGEKKNESEKREQVTTSTEKVVIRKSNVLMSSRGDPSAGDVHCGCKVSRCGGRRCACYRSGMSCANCQCNAELCQNSTKENNSSNVSGASSRFPNKISAAGKVKCACKVNNCSVRQCICRKNGAICSDNCKCNPALCELRNEKNEKTEKSVIERQASERSTDGKVENDIAARCLSVNKVVLHKNGETSGKRSSNPNMRVTEARRRLFAGTEDGNEENEDPRKRSRLDA